MAAPKVGAIIDGYRFLGGDPNNQASWQPAGVDEIAAAKVAGTAQGKVDAKEAVPIPQTAFDDAKVQVKDIDAVKQHLNWLNTGWIGAQQAPKIGKSGAPTNGWEGTSGWNLSKELGTIQARIMLANMAKLKNQSATGASGLGSLSIPEGDMLKSTDAPLSVGLPAKELRMNLERVREAQIRSMPGLSIVNPIDLSDGRSRTTIPKGAWYRDPQGNIRRNDNGDAGNPIFKSAAPKAAAAPPGVSVSNWN